jgi:hypothetical protein
MRIIPFFSLAILAAAFACGGDTQSQPDAGDDAGDQDVLTQDDPVDDVDHGQVSTTYPAFKIDAPLVQYFNGAVLLAPKIVPVYFGNDTTTFTDQLTAYLNKLATTSATYWLPAVSEYSIGALTIATPIQLTESPGASPLADSTIQSWLLNKLQTNDPAWPQPDANTLYVLFYPAGTTITLGQNGGSSCSSFGGYHSNISYNAKDVAYAVLPRCTKFAGQTGLDAVTGPTSHELAEAATDPYPQDQGNAAFAQVDDNHIIWEFILGGGEIGDMCAQNPDAFFKPADIGNYVQRMWSNKNASAGHNPCQPAQAGLPYFNSMPVLPDKISIGQGTTEGIQIPVGQSKTIEVDLFSDANTGAPWAVSAIDAATLQQQPPELSFTWDKMTGQNGEKLYLTIKVLKASQYGAEAFIIQSQLGARASLWMGLVGN